MTHVDIKEKSSGIIVNGYAQNHKIGKPYNLNLFITPLISTNYSCSLQFFLKKYWILKGIKGRHCPPVAST
jgi:hypothetical protein